MKACFRWLALAGILAMLLACASGDSEKEYEVGDIGPAGGMIFYVDRADAFPWTYLGAAPPSTLFESVPWSTVAQLVGPAAQGKAIGTGKANTQAIVAAGLEGAAKSCDDLVVNGYGDWFLPSKDELMEFRNTLIVNDLGGYTGGECYWTSSEVDDDQAWLNELTPAYENEVQMTKTHEWYRALAIRAF